MTIISETFEAGRVLALTGFKSLAMLDYLQRSGIFRPTGKRGARGRGRARRYTFRDVLVLKAINRLLESGASVAALKTAFQEFQKLSWTADPATLEDKGGAIRYFIANAGHIYLAKDGQTIVDLSNKDQLAFSFIIDLDILHSELVSSIGYARPQQEFNLA